MKPGKLSIALAALTLAGSQAAPTRAEHEGAALLAVGGFALALHLSGVLDGHGPCARSGNEADDIRHNEREGRPDEGWRDSDRPGRHRRVQVGPGDREPQRRSYGCPVDRQADNPRGGPGTTPHPWAAAPGGGERRGAGEPQYRQPPRPQAPERRVARAPDCITWPKAACRVLTGVGAAGRPAPPRAHRTPDGDRPRHGHR